MAYSEKILKIWFLFKNLFDSSIKNALFTGNKLWQLNKTDHKSMDDNLSMTNQWMNKTLTDN